LAQAARSDRMCGSASDCVLHPNVTIYGNVTVGDRAVLHSGCVLGADGFGFVRTGDHYEKFPRSGASRSATMWRSARMHASIAQRWA